MPGIDPVFAWVARLGLCLLFGAASIHKLRDLPRFTATLRGYRLLPDEGAAPAARLLVGMEVALVPTLLTPAADPAGPLAALLLLTVYTAAIAVNLARGRRDIDCGCLGPAHRQPLSVWLLVRNAVVAGGPLVLLLGDTARAASWIDGVSVGAGTLMVVLLFIAANGLAGLAGRGRPWAALGAQGRSS